MSSATSSNEEMNLAAQIAQLEAELERAKLERQLKQLQSELQAMDGTAAVVSNENNNNNNNVDEYLIIDEEDDYEYENTGDDYYEEYIEEEYYDDDDDEEEYTEEEEYIEEYVEDDDDEEEPAIVVAPTQASSSLPVISSIPPLPLKLQIQNSNNHENNNQGGVQHLNLRKTSTNIVQKEIDLSSTTTIVSKVPISLSQPVAVVPHNNNNNVPVVVVVEQQSPPSNVVPKSKVRPPPNQGGTPIARVEPKEKIPQRKKFPLSGLFRQQQRNPSTGNNEDGTFTNQIIVPKRGVPKKPLLSSVTTSNKNNTITPSSLSSSLSSPNNKSSVGTATTKATTTFQRRVIPNVQPSREGDETIFEQLLGPKLLINRQLQKCTTRGCLQQQELIGLYFGASWKSDCKRFVPLLTNFYTATANTHNFEIIYISADRSLIEFKDCYGTMPFLAIPAGTTALKNELTKTLKIIDMPALVILDDEANVVTVQGVQIIQELHVATTTNNTTTGNENGSGSDGHYYTERANQLMDKWKKTRPIAMSEVKKDNALLYNTIDRGTVYWN